MDRIAVCIDGVEDENMIAAAIPWVTRFGEVEVWCAYGDVAEREVQHARDRHGRTPPPRPRHDDATFDREQAAAIAGRSVALMAQQNVKAAARVISGRDAGHALASASGSDAALLLAAGHREGVGPHAVGHVARFVVDHARGPVIVIRLR
jgi:nucleotide-binding universal stress UspA family protein